MKFKPTIIYASMLAVGAAVSMPAFAHDANSQAFKMQQIMNQNQYNAGDSANAHDWFKRVTVSGLVNFDATYATKSRGSAAAAQEEQILDRSTTNFAVNNANIFVDAPINNWTNAHVSLQYMADNSMSDPMAKVYSAGGVTVDEAYVDMHNFDQMPFFVKAGVQYVDFGAAKDKNPAVYGLSQLLSQTKGTAVTVGMVTSQGFYGSAYLFPGLKNAEEKSSARNAGKDGSKVNNGGLQVGWATTMNGFSFDGALGYLYDMSSASYVTDRIAGNPTTATTHRIERVGAMNAHANMGFGPFYGNVDFTRALAKFNQYDLSETHNGTTKGAKPWAVDVNAGYRFKTAGHDSSVELGYGHTDDAGGSIAPANNVAANDNPLGLYLPENRYMASYNVNVMKNTDLGVYLVNDHDYSKSDGGTGDNWTTAKLRLAVHFA